MNAVFEDESESTEQFEQRLNDDEFDLRFSDIKLLSVEQKAKLLPYRKMAEAWWAQLQSDLEAHAAAGETVPGHKVVAGRSKRKFRNENAAKSFLLDKGLKQDDFITQKLATPAQVEKTLAAKLKIRHANAKRLLEELVYKPPGKASLVPLSDRRPALEDLSSVAFEDESETSDSDEEL